MGQSERHIHISVEDPFQILLAFVLAARSGIYPAEKFRLPFDPPVLSFFCLLSLHVLNLRLLVSS